MIYDKYQLNNVNPEDTTAGSKDGLLETTLRGLKDKYEIKLEKESQYTARPDASGTIDVTEVQSSGTSYKGYKHQIPGATGGTINYISIYNQPIKGVTEVEDGQGFQTQNGGGLYVYYESDIKKPLLICLSQTGTQSQSNKWYKREKGGDGYTWKNAAPSGGTSYEQINPGPSIGEQLKQKLDGIKTKLDTPAGTDKGYTPLEYILKLDYVPKEKGAAASIKYVTGNDNNPSNRVITVEKKEGSGDNVPEGYVAYSHSNSTGQLADVKFKHNGELLKGIPKNKTETITIASGAKVWVFYEKKSDGDPKLDTPLLLYFQQSNNNNWYGRGKKWVKHSDLDIDASGGLPGGSDKNKIESKLNEMARHCTAMDFKFNYIIL